MPIIDAHAHIYPIKIASKAVAAVGRFYGVEQSMAGEGSVEDLLTNCEKAGITHYTCETALRAGSAGYRRCDCKYDIPLLPQ